MHLSLHPALFCPAIGHNVRSNLKKYVEETDSINADLRVDMCLRRGSEEQKEGSVRSKVILLEANELQVIALHDAPTRETRGSNHAKNDSSILRTLAS
jgi:hypothetical protein